MKSWWKQSELRIDEVSEAERHATWLELYFDQKEWDSSPVLPGRLFLW
jgi:hypothetical protein